MSPRRHPRLASSRIRAEPDAPLAVARLGTVPYRTAWDLQRRLVDERRDGRRGDVLLLLEHPKVYTFGSRADRGNLLLGPDELERRGIEVVEVDRGGDVTYHGPGQLVGYPILALAGTRAVVDHVRTIEEVLLRTLEALGVRAQRSPGFTGVWVGDEKIAAIGVRVAAGGISSHGFALNVTTDLADFDGIVPCGIADRGVCSLASLGVRVTVTEVMDVLEPVAAEVYAATLAHVGSELAAPTATPDAEATT